MWAGQHSAGALCAAELAGCLVARVEQRRLNPLSRDEPGSRGNCALVSVDHMSLVGVTPVLPATLWKLGDQFASGLRGACLS